MQPNIGKTLHNLVKLENILLKLGEIFAKTQGKFAKTQLYRQIYLFMIAELWRKKKPVYTPPPPILNDYLCSEV